MSMATRPMRRQLRDEVQRRAQALGASRADARHLAYHPHSDRSKGIRLAMARGVLR